MNYTEQDFRRIAKEEATQVYNRLGTQYGNAKVPTHSHNNIDSIQPPQFSNIPTSGEGVLSPTKLLGLVKGSASSSQFLNQSAVGTPNLGSLVTVPIPVIEGSGTTNTLTMTGSPIAGATSATLTGVWGGTTELVTSQFGNNEIRNVKFTNGSAGITWIGALAFNTASTSLVQIANARFHGGDAPLGTLIAFVNTDDGLYQLWIRADLIGGVPDLINKWVGFDNAILSP